MAHNYVQMDDSSTFCNWCKKKSVELTVQERCLQLEDCIIALDVKLQGMFHNMNEKKLQAKQYYKNKDITRTKSTLITIQIMQQKYNEMTKIHGNLERILLTLERTSSYETAANCMGMATKVLAQALEKISPEKIDDLLDTWQTHNEMIGEVGNTLSENFDDYDFDIDSEMDSLLSIDLPDVPKNSISKTNKSKDTERVAEYEN